MSQCIVPVTEDAFLRKKFETNELYFAAQWMLRQILPSETVDNLHLTVYIRKMKHQRGVCWSYQDKPLEYQIVIDSDLSRRESLRALAHETVHVMQYATGKMKDLWGQNKGKVMWKTEMHDNSYVGRAYYDSPWEKEAILLQENLMQAYLLHVERLLSMDI